MLYNYYIEESLGAQDIKLEEYEFDGKPANKKSSI